MELVAIDILTLSVSYQHGRFNNEVILNVSFKYDDPDDDIP